MQQYIDRISQSKSIAEWNAIRQDIIEDFSLRLDDCRGFGVDHTNAQNCDELEKEFNTVLNVIDTSGLIVEVLGQDESGKIHRQNHPHAYY